uniref:Uncharacterized protein n=1 Tax=Oncorhynchus mykiss TaxID=8022 RepID=A0A8C7VZ25_ONCMY
MLGFLTARQAGLDDTLCLRRTESTMRGKVASNLQQLNMDMCCLGSTSLESWCCWNMLSRGADGVIVVFDLDNKSRKPQYPCKAVCTVDSCVWLTYLMNNSEDIKTMKLHIWNHVTTKFEGNVYCHHMSPISRKHSLIAVGTKDQKVQFCDLKSGSCHILATAR